MVSAHRTCDRWWCADGAYPGIVLDRARDLITRIIEALPGFLEARLEGLGLPRDGLAHEIERAVAEAQQGLEALLGAPFDRQPETPLEIVRRAIAPVGEAVASLGVAPPASSDEQRRVAPDDPYALSPASAAELGDAALEASLAWGLAKTQALMRPTLLVVTSSLMDSSRFEPAAASAGYRVETRRDPRASTTPLVAFVDLEHDGADEAIRLLTRDGVRVIAYGPHVDDQAMVRAMALGAAAAEPRSRMFRNPAEHLRPLV